MKNTIENQITEVEQKLSFLDQKIGDINTTFEDLELTFVSSFIEQYNILSEEYFEYNPLVCLK